MNSSMYAWRYAAIALLVACSNSAADTGTSGNNGAGGAGGTSASGGSGGAAAGTGGMQASMGQSGSGGHDTAGHGAGGMRGGNAGSSGGTGGASGGDSDAGKEQNCPPECLRAYTCAASCDKAPFNNGCCPCPAGTIDTISCSASGYCGLPCTGAAPDDAVVASCQTFSDEASCTAWQGNGFPNHCEWHTPSTPPCMAP